MYILGILVLIAVIIPASVVVGLALCKSMAITDDLNRTRR
jgi:hypothetical protein